MAADPTYPLYPIIALFSCALLLSLLMTNFVRQSWNLGVAFLCFWLFLGNFFDGVDAIIWSSNADIKLYAYCDIVSHIYMFVSAAIPACTLIITRRLHKIASLQPLSPENRQTKVTDTIIEWSVGLAFPALSTDYIVQGHRFEVNEGTGCVEAVYISGVEVLLLDVPGLIMPLISICFYCPKIMYIFYRHSRDTNRFLRTNGAVSRSGYFRILALGCLDIFLSLPTGIIKTAADTRVLAGDSLQFYAGWNITHSPWQPYSVSWKNATQGDLASMLTFYSIRWGPPLMALATFALFSFTAETCATYKRGVYAVLKVFGWTPSERRHEDISELQFGIRSLVHSGQTRTQQSVLVALPVSRGHAEDGDLEQGLRASAIVDCSEESKTSDMALQSGLPNVETAVISPAEHGELAGDGENSNIEDKIVNTQDDDHDRNNVQRPRFADLNEVAGLPVPTRLLDPIGVAQAAQA